MRMTDALGVVTTEMVLKWDTVGLRKGMTVVTDKWLGSVAAIKRIKRREGWTDRDLPHEVVVHSQGEIKNERGFHTNSIENRWSVLKRWTKKRTGGKLPSCNNRVMWNRLVTEFQYRKVVPKGYSVDGGHICVATKSFLRHPGDVWQRRHR